MTLLAEGLSAAGDRPTPAPPASSDHYARIPPRGSILREDIGPEHSAGLWGCGATSPDPSAECQSPRTVLKVNLSVGVVVDIDPNRHV